jgi:hypothetical protein
MKRDVIATASAALVIWAMTECAPVQARQIAIAPQPYLYQAPTTTYYYPMTGYTTVRTNPNRGALRRLMRRGGVVTTPYPGTVRAPAPYTVNPGTPVRSYRTYVYPAPTYVYPARVGGWFR